MKTNTIKKLLTLTTLALTTLTISTSALANTILIDQPSAEIISEHQYSPHGIIQPFAEDNWYVKLVSSLELKGIYTGGVFKYSTDYHSYGFGVDVNNLFSGKAMTYRNTCRIESYVNGTLHNTTSGSMGGFFSQLALDKIGNNKIIIQVWEADTKLTEFIIEYKVTLESKVTQQTPIKVYDGLATFSPVINFNTGTFTLNTDYTISQSNFTDPSVCKNKSSTTTITIKPNANTNNYVFTK